MKSVLETLTQRRSIRRYEREPINREIMKSIYDAIRNTPTSYNGQQFSVIDISDQSIKEELYLVTQQKQVKTCNHLLVFCADFNKIKLLADHYSINYPKFEKTIDGLLVGVIDATLAMMNALVAAEAHGLGTCCIGYVRTVAPENVSKLLGLPKGVFAVCGLAIGIPREKPDIKPKQPQSLLIHQNHYRTDDMTSELADYDALISVFNRTRCGDRSDNDWVAHILDYYRFAMTHDLKPFLNQQGFSI